MTQERSKLGAFRAAGITRLSIGIQSLRDRTLRTLGRMHTRADGLATINEAHRVFGANAFSVDAMYGVPGLSVDEWREDISEMTSMAGGHLSIYQLSVERGTPFFDKYAGSLNKYARSGRNNSNSGGMNASSGGRLPSEDIVAAMDEATREATRASGHRRYEVSSYARPGCEAVHNGGTWLGRDYIGVGPGGIHIVLRRCFTFKKLQHSSSSTWSFYTCLGRCHSLRRRACSREVDTAMEGRR